jgi:hypothetical protein
MQFFGSTVERFARSSQKTASTLGNVGPGYYEQDSHKSLFGVKNMKAKARMPEHVGFISGQDRFNQE